MDSNFVLETSQDLNLYPEYVEPIYPFTQVEYYDEDNMKYLLSDTRFNKQDRKRLTDYNKHRQSGSQVLVQYKLATGCEENQLGRLFPNDGLGLQTFRFDIRNPLIKKHYWDTDMENAHYCIAERWCDKMDLPHIKISYYIRNRNDCLKMVSNNRKKAKTEFLKILYGGNIKLYNEDFEEQDGEIKSEGMKFLKELEKEVKPLMDKIWEQFPQYHKLKCGKDKIPILKKTNPKASLMSLLFQTDERKILMFYRFLLKIKYNRVLGIPIHDGGGVEKIDNGETEFPKEIMEDCSRIITAKFKIRCVITQKDIEYDWTPLKPKLTEYETRKLEFEKKNFFVGSQFIHIQPDGIIEYVKPNDMKTRMKCNNYYEYDAENDRNVKKYFFEVWLEDPDRAKYERIDFIPDLDLCPSYVFNLFKGFNAEKFKPEFEISKEEIDILIEPILKHIGYLTGGHIDYFTKWLANIVQNPTRKSEVAILLRDEGGLLTEGGGTGKNLLMEWFGNEIIGEDYFYVVGDNREVYGTFNSQFEGKLFVMIEEASSKENHSNHDILKSKITSKRQNVNKKCVAQYVVRDFINYLFCSNNRNSLPIKQGNRRMAVMDTDCSMRGNTDYFTNLANKMNEPKVKWAFYQYLKHLKTYDSPIKFQNNIPNTPAYREVRILNSPLHLKWIVSEVKRGLLKDDSVRELYFRFRSWVKENKEGNEDNIPTETSFGLLLNKSTEAGKNDVQEYEEDYQLGGIATKFKSSKMIFKWNIPAVVSGLKKLYLLNEDFIYHVLDVEENINDCNSIETITDY